MRLNIFKQDKPKQTPLPLFDEAFLRRLERITFRTTPSLRGITLGERRSRNLRPALDFSDHRPYSAGDDLRYVDWHAYGRHEDLFVKLGEATQNVNVHLLLDRSRSMSWQAEQQTSFNKWDAARRLAGALSYLGLAGGERIKITPFAYTLDESFGFSQGKSQVISALKFLTEIIPASPPAQKVAEPALSQNLMDYARSHTQGGLLVLISDLLDAAAAEDLNRGAERLFEGLRHFPPPRWQVMVIHLLTEQELDPTLEGDFDFQDVETSETLPVHLDSSTLGQYRLRVKRWCSEIQQACHRRNALYTRILAEWPLERSVIPYLRQRGMVQ